MKPCPKCGRRVQDAALKCHYCGAVVREPRPAPASQPPSPASAPRKWQIGLTVPITAVVLATILMFAWCRG